MKYIKFSSWFMGISMFMFGILKFVNPFKGWYMVQIANSHLGEGAYAMGIAGEIAIGLIFITSLSYSRKIKTTSFYAIQAFASGATTVIMLVALYVHLHSDVPADVLPMKIKPPIIPLFFMSVAISNLYSALKLRNPTP